MGLFGRVCIPLAGLKEATNVPQRKSLLHIVRTKSESTAPPTFPSQLALWMVVLLSGIVRNACVLFVPHAEVEGVSSNIQNILNFDS